MKSVRVMAVVAPLQWLVPLHPGLRAEGLADPVIVSATRGEQQLRDTVLAASVIGRQEIERLQAPTLVDLLQGQPGVEIGRNGGPGSVSSIFLRGQSSKSVALFIDDVRVQVDQGGTPRMLDIPPNQIERIEILRGNMGAIHGEAATGGVIHVYTRSGDLASGASGSASVGSRGTTDLAVGLQSGEKDRRIGVSVQRFETAGYSAIDPGWPGVNPDRDGFRRTSVFAHAQGRIGEGLSLGVQANAIRGRVDYDEYGYDYTSFPDVRLKSSLATHRGTSRSEDLTVYTRAEITPAWSSRLGFTRSNLENADFKDGALLPRQGTSAGSQSSVHWTSHYLLGPGRVAFGVEGSKGAFRSDTTTYNRELHAYYAGYSARLGLFDTQINLRRDAIEARSSEASVKTSATTWLIALAYRPCESLRIGSLVSTSFRAPGTLELFNPVYGNPALQPEDHRGFDLSLRHTSTLGTLGLTRFASKTRNAINYGPAAAGFRFLNLEEVGNHGYELSLAGSQAGWNYTFSAVWQDPRDLQSDQRLLRRARAHATIDLRKTVGEVSLAARLIASGNRADYDQNDRITTNPGFAVLHLFAAQPLGARWTARVRVENSFDKTYALANGYPAPPRGVYFSVHYQPGS